MNRIALALAALAIGAAAAAAAETPAKPALSQAQARQALAAALDYAKRNSAPGGAIAIVDDGGHVTLLHRIDGTFAAAADISVGKARTAALFKRPTRTFEDLVNRGRTTMVTLPGITSFTPLKGGVPLIVDGRTIGAIGVSGAASAEQDDEIAQAAADALQAGPPKPAATLLRNGEVAAAFAKGATLLENGEYKIHASRRDGPGEAEIHLADTDIFYVLDGRATFVTGGEIVGSRAEAPGELRGSAIKGGTTETLAKGDIIVIPRGVPHWFKEVKAPFVYYVVKTVAAETTP